jgi:hypothetical protein
MFLTCFIHHDPLFLFSVSHNGDENSDTEENENKMQLLFPCLTVVYWAK